MFTFLRDAAESAMTALSWILHEPATSFVDLETVDHGGESFVATDGSLATVIRVSGSSRLVGEDEYEKSISALTKLLDSSMKQTGHALQVYWIRDPEGAREIVRKALEPARLQADQLQLDFKDLLDEKERELTKYVSNEGVYFVCWTHPSVLPPMEAKSAIAQQQDEMKVFNGMNFADAQNPRRLLSALRNRHQAFAHSVSSELTQLGLLNEKMEAHDAVRAMRMSVDPESLGRAWRATLPGDRIPVRFPIRHEEVGAVWWPPLASQIWPRDATTSDGRFIQIGDRVHAPMYVETPPVRVESFQALIDRAMNLDPKMPWTVSFMLTGNGLRKQQLKASLGSVLKVMNSDNGYIRDAVRDLTDFSKNGAVVGFQVCFNTWAPVGQTELLRQRAARLSQAFIDWGGAETREATGDPVEGFTSTAMGLTYKSVASQAAAPLMDVVRMLPITRPASPWPAGAELFTSPDGKLMPYQPGSALQSTWISLYTGGPGSGKSMQMFKQHFASCLAPQPGVTKLPYISIIDIGPSSAGLASLLKHALPPAMRHHVSHYRVRNTEEFCFNPFDLQLGRNYPMPEERAALIDLVTMIVTPSDLGVAYEGTAELVGMCIDEMYTALMDDDRGRPHEYHPGVDEVVDAAIAASDVEITPKMSWYGVRDALYRRGRTHEALLAQRYAVPVLADAASAVRSSTISDTYAKKLTGGQGSETLAEAFGRLIQSACREYKVLGGPTRFDIGESRVNILDLDEVAKGGGPSGQKQIAVMYGLSIYMLTRNFTLTKESVADFPAEYRPYHFARVQALSKELKTICCDEFHRTSQKFSTLLRERIKVFGREGRKWGIQVMLGSQRLADYDEEMVSLATAIYMMERPDESLLQEYVQRFGLSDTETNALRNGVRGPRAGGSTFFVRMKMKDGYFNQLLRNPAGPLELWAGSTTQEDKVIRELVYERLGPSNGRMALAVAFPGGSAQKECELRKTEMTLRGKALGDQDDDLFRIMAAEVVDAYRQRGENTMRDELAAQALLNT